jgi:aspartate aminotransferase
VIGQHAAIGALDTPDSYFDAVKEEYIKRRDFMINGLNKIEGVFTPLPMGAFYTIAELPVDDTENFARWMLETFRIDNETTMVTPAASFYKTPGMGKNHARIAYVLEVPEMEKALRILEEGLKAYPGRTI